MSQRLIATALFVVCCGGFAPWAHGQVGRRAKVNRPSTNSPSALLGRVGGLYTRQYNASTAMGGAPAGGGRGMPALNFFGAAGNFGRVPPAPMPQALTFAPVGYAPGRSGAPALGWEGGVSSAQLARISGLQASQSLTAPLTGFGPYHLRLPDWPYYAPTPGGGAIHEFFGLEPTQAVETPRRPIPASGLVGLLEQENEQLVQQLRSRAVTAFKQAMKEGLEERGELLSAAQRHLSTMRDVEQRAYIPCLLLVHTALEKGQILQAMRYLIEAVQRHPAVFVDRPAIASYYGDAEWLEDQQQWHSPTLVRQMRKYLRIGDENPGNPTAYILQAYCAWVLNDRTRVRQALDQVMTAEQGKDVSAEIIAVRHALAATIN